MSAEPRIRIFKAARVAGDGRPVVVVVASQTTAEYFAFVCNDEKSFYSQRIRLRDGSVRIGTENIELGLNFMISFAREMAEERLNVHLMNKLRDARSSGDYSVYRLEEADTYDLVRLYLQGRYEVEIDLMEGGTAFEELSSMVWSLKSLRRIELATVVEQGGVLWQSS